MIKTAEQSGWFWLVQVSYTAIRYLSIDCSIQPLLLIIELDRCLINRNVIRIFSIFRLYIGLVNSVMGG